MTHDRMRWDCSVNGCYRKLKCPQLSFFDDCFPGRIGMGDIDGIVEINGHVLIMEWKSNDAPLPTGQRILFERLTRISSEITVVIVVGDSDTMEVKGMTVFSNGRPSPNEKIGTDALKERFKRWTTRAQGFRKYPYTQPALGLTMSPLEEK